MNEKYSIKILEQIGTNINFSDLFTDKFEDFCKFKIIPIINKNKREFDKILKDNSFMMLFFSVWIFVLSFIFFGFFFIHFVSLKNVSQILLAVLIPLISFPIYFVWLLKKMKAFSRRFEIIKEKIFPTLFSYLPNCNFLTSKDEDYNLKPYLKKLNLIKKLGFLDNMHYEDRINCQYNGLDIDICEIILLNKRNYNYSISFTGSYDIEQKEVTSFEERNNGCSLFLRVKSNKKCKGKTFISSNFLDERLKLLDKKIKNEKEITLEDVEFNKLFNVVSTDQIEARYLITPAFMNRLKKVVELYAPSQLNISFENGYVNILFNSYNINFFSYFYTNKWNENDIINNSKNLLLELCIFISLLDCLNLDENIGM